MQQISPSEIRESTDRWGNVIRRVGDRLVQRAYNPGSDLFMYETFAPIQDPKAMKLEGFGGSALNFDGEPHQFGEDTPGFYGRRTWSPIHGESGSDGLHESLKLIREFFPETNMEWAPIVSGIIFLGPEKVLLDGKVQRENELNKKCKWCSLQQRNHGHDIRIDGHIFMG